MEKGKADDAERETFTVAPVAPVSPVSLEAAEANGRVRAKTESVATTRIFVSDDNSDWRFDDRNTVAMGKLNDNVDGDDGAEEKMLNDGTNVVAAKQQPTEVKFISDNGDAKIDIETVKKTLCGMGKEELMKYAEDPFWIRLRWILFIGFWLVWLGMLAGAIVIILMAPKCSAPEPKKWWESSPIVRLDPIDIEGRDDNGIASLLTTLQDQHVKVLSLSNFVGVNGHTVDFRDVQPKVGGIAKLDAIVKAAKERDQRVVLEIDPNHSSIDHPWFQNSVKRENPYTDYYVWSDGRTTDSASSHKPPNNWLSVNGGSAWQWNEARGQYYLHQFNVTQPDLNFNNPAVVAEIGQILNHWLDRGIYGFRLGNTRYLTEDPNLRDESRAPIPANPEEHRYLHHVHTSDRSENAPILRQWREIVMNRTKGDGLFALRDYIGPDTLELYNGERTLVDLPQRSQFLEIADERITESRLMIGVSDSIKNSEDWPSWEVNGNKAPLRKRMPVDVADSIVLMTLLLPGTPILNVNDTLSAKEAFATITNARTSQTFANGSTEYMEVNGTVFVYLRLKSGNPGYLVAYQSADEPAIIDLSNIHSVPGEVNVLAHSPNYVQDGKTIQTKLSSDRVPISAKSTLVLSFVPHEKQKNQ